MDFPKECFFGEDLFSAKLTGGRDTGCFASFLRGVLVEFFLKIFSELPVNFSRLELVELVESSIFLVFNGAAILLAPAVVLDGFLVLASSVVVVVVLLMSSPVMACAIERVVPSISMQTDKLTSDVYSTGLRPMRSMGAWDTMVAQMLTTPRMMVAKLESIVDPAILKMETE